MEEERTGRGPRGEQSTEREAWATQRAGCRSARKRSPSLRESGLQGGHGARGGDLRDTDRCGGRQASRRPRASASSGSALAGPGPRPGRGGHSAYFLTRLRAALKGPAPRAFRLSRGRRERAPSPAGARRHVCTCVRGPALFFWEAPEDREGFAGARASPISWKGFVTRPATLAVCSPGLFRLPRLGQLLLHHLPRK